MDIGRYRSNVLVIGFVAAVVLCGSGRAEEECYYEGMTLNNGVIVTQTMYDNWVYNGSPDIWCEPCHVYGNANGDYAAFTAADVAILAGPGVFNSFCGQGLYDYRADFNHDCAVTALDVAMVLPYFSWAWCGDVVQ